MTCGDNVPRKVWRPTHERGTINPAEELVGENSGEVSVTHSRRGSVVHEVSEEEGTEETHTEEGVAAEGEGDGFSIYDEYGDYKW